MAAKDEDDDKGILDALRAAVSDRLKSFFLGSFAIAWLVCHWQAVYVIVFLEPMEMPEGFREVCYPDKIQYVRGLQYTWWEDFVLPFFLALLPVGATFIDELLKGVKKKMLNWGLEFRASWAKEKVFSAEVHFEALNRIDQLRGENEMLTEKARVFEENKKRFEDLKRDVETREADMGQRDSVYEARIIELEQTSKGKVDELERRLTHVKKLFADIGTHASTAKQLEVFVGRTGQQQETEKQRAKALVVALDSLDSRFRKFLEKEPS